MNESLQQQYATELYRFANVIAKADNHISTSRIFILKEIYRLLFVPDSRQPEEKKILLENQRKRKPVSTNLQTALDELNSLIGLENVKTEINTLVNYIRIKKARERSGLRSPNLSYHMVFTGNPGTGKTTVARIVASIYKQLGVISEGQLIETGRSGLVAEYAGQTAVKTNKIVDTACNGVLFIDEAYSLVGKNNDDFGKEAVATLIKRMEDDRNRLVVILAGYTEEIKKFIETNPGIQSRVSRYINFPDYSPKDLMAIFEGLCSAHDYLLSAKAKKKLMRLTENIFANRNRSFGNGRFVRNIFEKAIANQANRIAGISSLNNEILTTIQEEDICG